MQCTYSMLVMKSRNELLEFLEDFRHKKNDEGNLIIQFPKNFDQISDAMTRQDLISTDDR